MSENGKDSKGMLLKKKGEKRELMEILASFKKNAWIPVVDSAKSDPLASKFSGIPFLSPSERWPVCKNCQEPMQLFLQLNSDDLPPEAGNPFGPGVLQVYYCTGDGGSCEIDCEAFFPFSLSTLVRIVDKGVQSLNPIDKSPVSDAFPEKRIIGWVVKADYPHWEELEGSDFELTDEQGDLLCDLGYPLPKDKLLGWPNWIQGVEYPTCPECENQMKLIFQIDSEDNLPYMFGDVGCAHITQCDIHKHVLTIAWACS